MKNLSSFLVITLTTISLSLFSQINALNFDGIDDFVDICSNCVTYGSSTITYEAWVNVENADDTLCIICRGNIAGNRGVSFGVRGNKVWVGGNNGGGWNNSYVGTISNNTWTHIAAVYNETTTHISVFINGVFIETVTQNFIINGTDFNTIIGKNQIGSVQYIEGSIDELRIWDTLRTQAEIQSNMNDEIDCINSHLIACYQFNQGVANGNNSGVTTLEDGTSNNFDGTLSGFALMGDSSNWVLGAPELPIELSLFEGKAEKNKVFLHWENITEKNNYGCQVERSMDGKIWESISFVKGTGTSIEIQKYHYIDEHPFNGINYYRLKQLDFDGKFNYSKVISVTVINKNEIKFYPNPTSGKLEISGIVMAKIKVYDVFGRIVKEKEEPSQNIDISEFPNGLYFILMKTDKMVIIKQIIKSSH